MSDRQRLRDIMRPSVEAVINPRTQRRVATISTAFDHTGNLKPEAFPAEFVLTRDFSIIGTASTGAGGVTPKRMPQTGRVVRLYANAGTAPSGGEFTAQLYADGDHVASVSISNGQTSGVTPDVNETIPAGSTLTWNVTTANGAANVELSLVYRPVSS